MVLSTIKVNQQNYHGDVSSSSYKRCGQGTYKYSSDFTYTGSWDENGKKHGHGSFTLDGYCTYTGDFADGEMTGKGCMQWADGRSFSGDFFHGEMHGRGIWSNGHEIYEGDFKFNQRSGFGKLSRAGEMYSGIFKSGRFHGNGELRRDNFVYRGEFCDGRFHEHGELVDLREGSIHRGLFSSGKKHGRGTQFFEKSKFVIFGNWIDGVAEFSAETLKVDCANSLPQNDPKRKALSGMNIPDAENVPIVTASAGETLPRLIIRSVSGERMISESARVLEFRLTDRKVENFKITRGRIASDFQRVVVFEGCAVVDNLVLPKQINKGSVLFLEISDVTQIPESFRLPCALLAILIN